MKDMSANSKHNSSLGLTELGIWGLRFYSVVQKVTSRPSHYKNHHFWARPIKIAQLNSLKRLCKKIVSFLNEKFNITKICLGDTLRIGHTVEDRGCFK